MRMSKDFHILYVFSSTFWFLLIMCRSSNNTKNMTDTRKSAESNASVLLKPVNTGKDESFRCHQCDPGGTSRSITQHWIFCKMRCKMMMEYHFRVLRNGQCVCGQGPDFDVSCAALGRVGCWTWCFFKVMSFEGACDSLRRCHCGPIQDDDPSHMYDELDHSERETPGPCCDQN